MKSIFFTFLSLLFFVTSCSSNQTGIIYSNSRVYNVDFSFEMVPDPNKIDRAKDLKVWLPMPREWDSQKSVDIFYVQPEPDARYVDPEYGNSIFYWDFGKEPEKPSYKVDVKFRLESYDVKVEVDPNRVDSYDKKSKEYALYTRSTHTNHITPKIEELAKEAIGDETNPYLQAERIVKFVEKKMHYKRLSFERGRGIDCLLAYPVTDEKAGQVYYEGSCNQYTALMVAMCRAVGIPARSVFGYMGWNPGIEPNDAKARYPFETKLSPDGLGATQLYGKLGVHMWGEFFVPNYGWIPADAQGGKFGQQSNRRWITSKGRDILLGPGVPPKDSEGYGAQWVALHDGRADTLFYGVENIAKIHNVKITALHHSDPFPTDAIATYLENQLTSEGAEELRSWRQGTLSWISCFTRNLMPESQNLNQLYKKYPQIKDDAQAFVCHMLRRQLGDKKFFKLVDRYEKLRQKHNKAVPTSRFQELAEDIYGASLDWFFNQWVNIQGLSRLKLEKVTATKDNEGWQVEGFLLQTSDITFRLPVEIAMDMKDGIEMQKLWMGSKTEEFHFHTQNEPKKLIIDPDYEVLKIQKMPPHLVWFWDIYPDMLVVYGTLSEEKANKTAAERFNNEYLGLGAKIIKVDTDVNEADLRTKCLVLFGRPETNKIAQKFREGFPVKFDGSKFIWQETTYDDPAQGIAQIIENPDNTQGLIVMYAGLSMEATQKFCDLYLYDAEASYLIFSGDNEILRGDWEDYDSDLVWSFTKK
jgi:hypothetical protein